MQKLAINHVHYSCLPTLTSGPGLTSFLRPSEALGRLSHSSSHIFSYWAQIFSHTLHTQSVLQWQLKFQ